MKKVVFVSFLMLALVKLSFAQGDGLPTAPERANIIKINPLSLGTLTFSGFYERFLDEKMSIQIGLAATLPFTLREEDPFNPAITSTLRFTCFGVTPEFRFYPGYQSRPVPEGFFFGPFIRYRVATFALKYEDREFPETNERGNLIWSQYAVGAVAGYQTILSDVLTFDIYGGPFYKYINLRFRDRTGTTDITQEFDEITSLFGARRKVGFRFGMTLGFRF